MDILTAIHTRRSIREFLPKKVPRELLEKIIEAAGRAPSDENNQPWHFTIVEDENIKNKIAHISVEAGKKYFGAKKNDLLKKFSTMGRARCEEMVERFTSGSLFSFLGNAPVLIVISSKNDVFSHCSTGAAVQNLLLAAMEFDLATCWTVIGLTDPEGNDQIKNIVHIPNDRIIVSVLALGYPAQEPKPRGRKKISEIFTWI
ncbi:nitroreductase family protein [Candidatus Peregrinibacteria bacterium]|nr:nitroreductase family protein [Candidatus Peregrinibacteria bacterium]